MVHTANASRDGEAIRTQKKLQENWPKMRGKGGVNNNKKRLCIMLFLLLLNLSKKTIMLT